MRLGGIAFSAALAVAASAHAEKPALPQVPTGVRNDHRANAPVVPLPPPAPTPGMVEAQANDVDKDFARAQSLLDAGKEDEALVSFTDFLRRYPHDALSDDAQFAVAELYFRRRKFDTALQEFRKVLEYGITKSDRIADAGVRMGECFVQLREPERAQIEWEAVNRRFPKTEAASKAKLLLAGLPK